MREIIGNIWDYHDNGNWIVITTNGTVKKNGEAVMGRGIAKQAVERFPELPFRLGRMITEKGNIVSFIHDLKIITLPVKFNWWEKADIKLIERGISVLSEQRIEETYMVRPGCGNGGLAWRNVKPILEKYLDDRFIVVELSE